MISVVATIQIKDGMRQQFLDHFLALVPTVMQEDGCIEYFPAIDAEPGLESQDRNANSVVVLEKWESLAALEAHLAADHMEIFRSQVSDIVTDISLKVLRPQK